MFPNNPQDWRPVEAQPAPPAASPEPTPRRRGGIVASLVALALFSALIGFAVDRYVTTNFNPPSPPTAAAAPTTVPSVPRIGAVAAQNGASPTATPAAGPSTTTAA